MGGGRWTKGSAEGPVSGTFTFVNPHIKLYIYMHTSYLHVLTYIYHSYNIYLYIFIRIIGVCIIYNTFVCNVYIYILFLIVGCWSSTQPAFRLLAWEDREAPCDLAGHHVRWWSSTNLIVLVRGLYVHYIWIPPLFKRGMMVKVEMFKIIIWIALAGLVVKSSLIIYHHGFKQ